MKITVIAPSDEKLLLRMCLHVQWHEFTDVRLARFGAPGEKQHHPMHDRQFILTVLPAGDGDINVVVLSHYRVWS